MATPRLRQTVLEVERKFARLRVHPLTAHAGTPAFRDLEYLGTKTFRDVYFDDRNVLSSSGSWVRQRDGKWETKIAQAGDYNDSQFREIYDLHEIRDHVQSITGKSNSASEAFGLVEIADITTHREAWKADGRFKIVLDRTDFDHTVGEVELEVSVEVGSDEEVRQQCSTMDSEIVKFMQRYQWAFDTGPAVGKLTAYFARRSFLLQRSTST